MNIYIKLHLTCRNITTAARVTSIVTCMKRAVGVPGIRNMCDQRIPWTLSWMSNMANGVRLAESLRKKRKSSYVFNGPKYLLMGSSVEFSCKFEGVFH